jgi:hypothetical protein
MAALIDPKEITITSRLGKEKTYIISEIPAYDSREIAAKYLVSALPKIGDYPASEAMSQKMMKFVEVVTDGGQNLRLTTKELVQNHCDFKQLSTLEKEMVMHNYGFFLQGTVSTFFGDIIQKGRALISKTSTDFSGLSSPKEPQASTNSEPSTP